MTTTQLLIVAVAALAAIAIVAYVHWRTRRDALDAEAGRAEQRADESADRRAEDAAAPPAAPPAVGPGDGAQLVVHVDGRAIRGTRVLAGDFDAAGWVVLASAVLLVGSGPGQELGGRQWVREDRLTQLQEL